MYIDIQATTDIHPQQFARALRAEIRTFEPDAEIRVRAIPAPGERRFQVVRSDGPDCIPGIMLDVIEAVRDQFEPVAVIDRVGSQEIVTLEWLAEHSHCLPHPCRIKSELVAGKWVHTLHR
jgi:hypothetical protein